jgi:hypothetical protein
LNARRLSVFGLFALLALSFALAASCGQADVLIVTESAPAGVQRILPESGPDAGFPEEDPPL